MVLPFISSIMRDVFETVPPVLKESAYALGATTAEVVWQVVLPYTRDRRRRRHPARPRPGARRDDGGHLRDRQRAPHQRLDPAAGNDDLGGAGQRIHRGGRRSLSVVADRARADPVRDHLHRAGGRQAAADPARKAGREAERDGPLSHGAVLANRMVMALSFARDRVRAVVAGARAVDAAGRRRRRDRPGAVHPDDAAARQQRRAAERDLRQPDDDRDRDR